MDGYHRQIHHGEYPLAIIAIDIAPHLVDVNVHPRKIQVKFVDYRAGLNGTSEA